MRTLGTVCFFPGCDLKFDGFSAVIGPEAACYMSAITVSTAVTKGTRKSMEYHAHPHDSRLHHRNPLMFKLVVRTTKSEKLIPRLLKKQLSTKKIQDY